YFFKSDGEIIFYIAGSIGIMGQLYMVVKPEFFFRDAQADMPFHPGFFPVIIPFFLRTGSYKKLHFHLLKFPHTKDKLARYDFIPECFSCLSDSEWNFHSGGF